MRQRILVTGASGALGAHLVPRLLAQGHEVTALVREGSRRIRLEPFEGRLRLTIGEMRHPDAVRAAVRRTQPQLVYHLASTPFNPPTTRAADHLEVNVLGTLHLIEALEELPQARVVFTGSAAAYGAGSGLGESHPLQPGTVLGASKAAASVLLQAYARLRRLQSVELRLFTPYGPWEHPRRVIPQAILSALDGQDVRMSSGEQQRDFIYLEDVAEALILAGTRPVPPGSVFNIGSGTGTPIRQVVESVLALMGRPVKPLFGALPRRPDEIMEMSADITAARERLGWRPSTPLEAGLRATIAWYAANRELAGRLASEGAAGSPLAVGAAG